jgi:hypothetical protein
LTTIADGLDPPPYWDNPKERREWFNYQKIGHSGQFESVFPGADAIHSFYDSEVKDYHVIESQSIFPVIPKLKVSPKIF